MINLQEKNKEILEKLKELRVSLEVKKESAMREVDENEEGWFKERLRDLEILLNKTEEACNQLNEIAGGLYD